MGYEDDTLDFHRADEILRRNGSNLSARDRQLNKRINDADKVATRYISNLQRKGGFSDMTIYSNDRQRVDAYINYKDKKLSYAARAGVSG